MVLVPEALHISHSLRKTLQKHPFAVRPAESAEAAAALFAGQHLPEGQCVVVVRGAVVRDDDGGAHAGRESWLGAAVGALAHRPIIVVRAYPLGRVAFG